MSVPTSPPSTPRPTSSVPSRYDGRPDVLARLQPGRRARCRRRARRHAARPPRRRDRRERCCSRSPSTVRALAARVGVPRPRHRRAGHRRGGRGPGRGRGAAVARADRLGRRPRAQPAGGGGCRRCRGPPAALVGGLLYLDRYWRQERVHRRHARPGRRPTPADGGPRPGRGRRRPAVPGRGLRPAAAGGGGGGPPVGQRARRRAGHRQDHHRREAARGAGRPGRRPAAGGDGRADRQGRGPADRGGGRRDVAAWTPATGTGSAP